MRKILLGVTGSIAAYKAADIVNRLIEKEFEVHVVMTQAATGFITPLTMQSLSKNRVYTHVLQEENPKEIVHIDLPQSVDCLLIAPATANCIGKIANGIADDMLTSMVLAVYDIPLLIAPAMNVKMFENQAVQSNLQRLKERGWQVIPPRVSRLACGTVGKGALADVNDITAMVCSACGEKNVISH